jgi:hypothetical protein
MEEAYRSAKLRAPERSEAGFRGYINRIRPMMVSTSPTPSTRRDISSLGEDEKEIKWKVSPILKNSFKKGPIR